MKSLIVFIGSVALAILTLALERLAGIDWDFHPDSVTYATTSIDMVNNILAQNVLLIFNNGYYFWAAFLDMNVTMMIATNTILYALTNIILFQFHERNCNYEGMRLRWFIALALLLSNPYRLHLATTPLKDTMILFLFSVLVVHRYRGAIAYPILFCLRIVSVVYAIAFMNKKQIIYVLVIFIVIFYFASDIIGARLLDFNAADMQLREFDRIPNFRELGLVGVFIRGLVWPVLAVTGLFAVLSPAFAFFAVSIGSVTNQFYCKMVTGKFQLPLVIFVPIAILAMMVTGFTAYIRYIYPLLALMPVFVIQQLQSDILWRKKTDRQNLIEAHAVF
jgi:hypothetical protein